jgi:hypothetical protein
MSPAAEQAPRPRQVTLAASLVMAASVMLVLSVFERLGGLRSLESRESVERFLSKPPGSDLGIGLESALSIMRSVSMVAAALATAAAILGWHVLRRNRAARIWLSILALPLFLCGLVTGGFLASVVAASVAMLWLAPARHWFDGTTPIDAVKARPDAGSGWSDASTYQGPPPPTGPRAQLPPLPPQGPTASQQPPPWTPSSGPYAAPQAGASPWTVPPPGAGASPAPRPRTVVAACVITWVCCAFAVLLSILLVGVLAADADGLFAEMQRQNPDLADDGVSDATLRSATWVTAAICLFWALLSGALAVLAFQRRRWAAVALAVSAGVVALFCLVGSVFSPPLAVPGLLAAATVGLLLQPSAQRWLARREAQRSSGMM